jgi:hydrogenase maturation protease
MRVVVLGIGNTLMSDESVGVRAVEALQAAYELPDYVEVIDGGTSGMELLDDLAHASLLLVVDAVYARKAPGELVHLAGADVPVFFRSKLSPHQISLSDVLASLEFAGQMPGETVVIGVQPQSFELGLELTPVVAASLPALVDMIVGELRAHGIEVRARTVAA